MAHTRQSPVNGLSWDDFVAAVQGATWDKIRRLYDEGGVSLTHLSEQTGLGVGTIRNFADRTTKNPSTRTVSQLAEVVLEMRLALIPNSVPRQRWEIAMDRFNGIKTDRLRKKR